MQSAFLPGLLLPPPPAGALRLARLDRTRARSATDRQKAPVVQIVVGDGVLADEREDPLARPVEQGIHLDEPIMRIDRSKGDAGALIGLVRA
jgi:hypothetical protein